MNIVLAIELLDDVKERLSNMRTDSVWEAFFANVANFCADKAIPVPDMDEEILVRGRSRRDGFTVTNLHYYRTEIYFVVVDRIRAEMDHRFNEVSSEILTCFACLHPKNSFSKFDANKLARLAEIYDEDFFIGDRAIIIDQLETFIIHVRRQPVFANCEDIASLATKMVETEKHLVFPLVYKLIELALILPVSTATVERAFSAMKIIKTELRNKISDDWLNDLIVCYTERDIFKTLDDDTITRRF